MTTLSTSKIRIALAIALAVASGSAALHAQDQTIRSKVDVPFAFELGSAHLAPGTYFLDIPREHVLSVRGASGTLLEMERPEASLTPAPQSKVVFHRYGDQYFLREVWVKGSADHLRCPESKAEQRARKVQQAVDHASTATPTSVQIALLEDPR